MDKSLLLEAVNYSAPVPRTQDGGLLLTKFPEWIAGDDPHFGKGTARGTP
jgi:hypothetical protein